MKQEQENKQEGQANWRISEFLFANLLLTVSPLSSRSSDVINRERAPEMFCIKLESLNNLAKGAAHWVSQQQVHVRAGLIRFQQKTPQTPQLSSLR